MLCVFVVTDSSGEPVGAFGSLHAARAAAEAGCFEEVTEVLFDGVRGAWDGKAVWRNNGSELAWAPLYTASKTATAGGITEVFVLCNDTNKPKMVFRCSATARKEAEERIRDCREAFWVKRFTVDAPCRKQPSLPRFGAV